MVPPSSPRSIAAHAGLVVVTGLSGSGKGTVLRALEDAGFDTVDNLPVELIQPFLASGRLANTAVRAAIVVDIREGRALARFPQVYSRVRRGQTTFLVYLGASNEAIQRRFSETRRPHPARRDTVAQSIDAERELLRPIRALADLEIDTSLFNVHDLRREILRIFLGSGRAADLRLTVGSFGFKYGPPLDADLVLDVRFLPNPNYEPGCRELTGKDAAVQSFLESYPETGELLDRTMNLLDFVVPRYAEEGKSYLSVYFGCTGGRHRSVYIADTVADRMLRGGQPVRVQHRDIHKEH